MSAPVMLIEEGVLQQSNRILALKAQIDAEARRHCLKSGLTFTPDNRHWERVLKLAEAHMDFYSTVPEKIWIIPDEGKSPGAWMISVTFPFNARHAPAGSERYLDEETIFEAFR